MNRLYVEHNPFTVETIFRINEQMPSRTCDLVNYKNTRLQLWVEHLFENLRVLFNNDTDIHVDFKGVESDFHDILEAKNIANATGMDIKLSWTKVEEAENRLDKIRDLMEEAKNNEQFRGFIERDGDVDSRFKDAFNNDFDVYVVATMSSGKSTLINAMLGVDLLPAKNEATTATIAEIKDNKQLKAFKGICLDKNDVELDQSDDLNLSIMEQWNQNASTHKIEIEGNITAFQHKDNVRLVLTDTPGPNNSQEIEHERITMSFIQDTARNPLILYVLNATQLGINDDKKLLGLVSEAMQEGGKQGKDRFIFVINKMDSFDPEKGEDIQKTLKNVQKYLEENRIFNPLIFPISAYLTRLLRLNTDQLTRSERGDLNTKRELFIEEKSMNMMQYMPLTTKIKRSIENKEHLSLVLKHSGLPAVEAMIDEYIDKYNVPHRLKRAHSAFIQIIEEGMNETELTKQLDVDEKALKNIESTINLINERKKKGFETKAYKAKLIDQKNNKYLPDDVTEGLFAVRDDCENELLVCGNSFEDVEDTPKEAERKINAAQKEMTFLFNKAINKYSHVFDGMQNTIQQELRDSYQEYVAGLFDDVKQLNLPILEGLKKSIENISLAGISGLDVRNEVKSRQIVVGQREVSDSSWWNPFSWGDKKTVYEYDKQEYVNLYSIWEGRVTSLRNDFSNLYGAAEARMIHDRVKLVDLFIQFMEREFDSKFNQLIDSLKENVADKGKREEAIEKAKSQQLWIRDFKEKLDQTLAI